MLVHLNILAQHSYLNIPTRLNKLDMHFDQVMPLSGNGVSLNFLFLCNHILPLAFLVFLVTDKAAIVKCVATLFKSFSVTQCVITHFLFLLNFMPLAIILV